MSPAIARALGEQLEVPVELVFFDNPGEVADAATENRWDIGNIGADPARSEHIAFSPAYSQIECTYLVRQGSPIESIDEVDRPGIRVVSKERAAYTLVLERDLQNAELIQTASIDGAFEAFVDDDLDVLAGLLPRLLSDADALPGARILDGSFATVQQAIGTPRDRDPAGVQYLDEFVTAAIASGLVADLIDHYQVIGLSAARVLTQAVFTFDLVDRVRTRPLQGREIPFCAQHAFCSLQPKWQGSRMHQLVGYHRPTSVSDARALLEAKSHRSRRRHHHSPRRWR